MKNFQLFKEIKLFVEEHSPKNYSVLFAIPIIFLIFGFLIWSIYLYTFGFVEDELLRAKFIFTGIAFIIISIFLLGAIDLLLISLSKIKVFCIKILNFFSIKTGAVKRFLPSSLGIKKTTLYSFFSIIWFFLYVLYIFPSIPGVLGGGQPRAISLIASQETMPLLNSLGIQLATGATHQTENVCIIHQNGNSIYILRNDRALMINNSLLKGLASLPGLRVVQEQYCIAGVKKVEMAGVVLELALIETQIANIYNSITGKPLIYLGVTNRPPVTLNK